MATTAFRMSAKTDKVSGKSEILVRFFHGSTDQRAKTGLFVTREYWDAEAQKLKIPKFRLMDAETKAIMADLSQQNSRLEDLKDFISQSFIEAGAGKIPLPTSWLSDIIRDHLFPENDKPVTLLDVFRHYIDIAEVSPIRRRNFNVAWRTVKRFFIFQGISLNTTLESVNTDTIRAFVEYLKNEHLYYKLVENEKGKPEMVFLNSEFEKAFKAVPESRPPQERGQNTVNNVLVVLRAFHRWAVSNGYTANNPFNRYEIPACIYGTPYYITIEERNRLYSHDFSDSPRLGTQRDIFVFQCVVGCRVSDLRSLTKDSVINGAIEYIPRKTKEGKPVTVRVPLNSVASAILEKYKDTPGAKLLPCISDQKYNDAIKEVFKAAGLTRMVTILNPTTRTEEKRPLYEVASSHLARRCFIGNLYKQVKDPNLIGKLSGHAEGSRAFARYRDIDEEMRKELVTMLE